MTTNGKTSPDAPKPMNLVQKLAFVMSKVGFVPKSGRNDFHKYDYATEADITHAVRGALAEVGVMIIPSVEKLELGTVPRGFDQKGNPKTERIATLTVRFTATDGTDSFTFNVIGEGTDSGDKATYKAMTGATKYALLKLFLIPTGDDPSPEGASDPEKEESDEKPTTRLDGLKAKVAQKNGSPGSTAERLANVSSRLKALGVEKRGAWVSSAIGHQFDGESMSAAEWKVCDGLLKEQENGKKNVDAAAEILGAAQDKANSEFNQEIQ